KRKEDEAERKGRDPRQVPLRADVRPNRVALSGLRMRVTEGAFVADPVLHGSVHLSSSRSWRKHSRPPTEQASRKRGTEAKSPQMGEYEGGRTVPLSAYV